MLRFANAHIAYTCFASTPSVAKFCSKILTLPVYNILHELCFIIPARGRRSLIPSAVSNHLKEYEVIVVTAIQKALMSKKTEESNKYG